MILILELFDQFWNFFKQIDHTLSCQRTTSGLPVKAVLVLFNQAFVVLRLRILVNNFLEAYNTIINLILLCSIQIPVNNSNICFPVIHIRIIPILWIIRNSEIKLWFEKAIVGKDEKLNFWKTQKTNQQ